MFTSRNSADGHALIKTVNDILAQLLVYSNNYTNNLIFQLRKRLCIVFMNLTVHVTLPLHFACSKAPLKGVLH